MKTAMKERGRRIMVGWRVAAMPGYVHIKKKKKFLILIFF